MVQGCPKAEFSEPFNSRILPLKDHLGAKDLKLEILKTGRRIWVNVFFTPEEETIKMSEFAAVKEKLSETAKEVYENTQIEVFLQAT